MKHLLILFFTGTLLVSCATYYQKNARFNQNFESGNLEEAEKILLNNSKKGEKGRNKLLHFLNLGVVASMQNKLEESNKYFEQAYIISDDYSKNYLTEAASLLSNPNLNEYKGEDHEILLLHYYKALNFLKMNDREAALVECRRMNNRLNQLSGRYSSENKYRKDAFIHTLMGLIYDASGEYNNAFIAYRNAVEIYDEDYTKLFGLSAPLQLKKDLLRTAYLVGFHDELNRFEEKFQMKYNPEQNEGGDMVFIWNNGLGPVKAEWGINFTILRGAGGVVTFHNEEMGLNFAFPMAGNSNNGQSSLSDLEFIRVVFPKYLERPSVFHQGKIISGGKTYQLEKAQDINAIAFKVLQQRMLLEFGNSLLRVALKKAAEYQLRKSNEGLGAGLGALNALTEKADTRNWQAIPHSIFYTRVPLKEGEQKVSLEINSNYNKPNTYNFDFIGRKGETIFHSFHTLESRNF